ncbi:MAG: UvrD-helicase domain-containing protein, partial [bacterium]
ASAAEMGLPPDFEISTESSSIIDYAALNTVESADPAILNEFLDLLNKSQSGGGLDFNPVKSIKNGMKHLLEAESNYNYEFSFDFSFKKKLDGDLTPAINALKDLFKIAESEGFEVKGNFNAETLNKIKSYLESKNYFGLINERKTFPFKKPKPKSGSENTDYSKEWEDLFDYFDKYLPDIAKLKNLPYLTLYESFKNELKKTYNILGFVYISDVNKKLSRFLTESSIPEIYFHLGNTIYHYFIDEFQDTSKVQWQNLKPLIEESLSKNGSLFTVGDLKQALYGFRGADYKIMKSLLEDGGKSFPSLNEFKRVSLKTNFRSDKVLVDYVNYVFKSVIKDRVEQAGDPAGFLTYEQDVPQNEISKNANIEGYCVTEIFNNTEQDDALSINPLDLIEPRLIEILEDLKARSYKYGDIAILMQKNKYLNDISGRLIEKGYPVVAQSSLDIRNRKVIIEIEMLLSFLNSPLDDFSFGCFILGDVFEKRTKSDKKEFEKFIFEINLKNVNINIKKPLYIEFREKYENLWNECFEELFNKTGYLPLYEIVLYIYNVFYIPENFSEESAYLAHFLDVIQSSEENGSANLNDLLELISLKDDESSELFSIKLPEVQDALTLLTVHKAKGLQWDIVINIFFAEENYALKSGSSNGKNNKGRNKNNFIVENEGIGGDKYLDMLYITKKMFNSSYLELVYNQAAKDENISDLNIFYVALTRAKHELYNLIISKGECSLPAEIRGKKTKERSGDSLSAENETVENGAAGNNAVSGKEITLECGYCDIGFEYAVRTGSQYLSIKRGDFYHRVLSEIKYAQDFENLDALIEKYMVLLGFKNIPETKTDIKEKILRIKKEDYLLKFFDKEIYEVFTEKEYLSAAGGIYRMDRVSVSKKSGEICVLDYKTGDINKKEEESYKVQLLRYKSVLADINTYKDKKISAVIYNIDKGDLLEY